MLQQMFLFLEMMLQLVLGPVIDLYQFENVPALEGIDGLELDVRSILPRIDHFRTPCFHAGRDCNQVFGHFSWHGTRKPF